MRNARFFTTLLLLAPLAGCARGAPEEPVPLTASTRLEVRNDNFNDMRIYVIRNNQRIRLGIVNGKSSQTFELKPSVVLGITRLRIEAVPVGSRVPQFSDELPVNQGDVVAVQITP